jgi:hypothetical protein
VTQAAPTHARLRIRSSTQEQLVKVEPIFAYLMRKVIEEMADLIGLFKACQLFDPFHMNMLMLPFISPGERAQLLLQLPIYRARAAAKTPRDMYVFSTRFLLSSPVTYGPESDAIIDPISEPTTDPT